MEETSKELPNISLGIDLLACKPASKSKNNENEAEQTRFPNLSQHKLVCGNFQR